MSAANVAPAAGEAAAIKPNACAPGEAPSWRAAWTLCADQAQAFGELVKFSHTIFLMPFALSAVVLAHFSARPVTAGRFAWIILALVSARSAAMVMNRIADRDIDALNPRTATRPLITGRVSAVQAWAWLLLSCGLFVVAAWRLGELPLWLSPVALGWVLGYSYTKRFTRLCHLWLGAATALAPLGAWVAVTGNLEWRAWLIFAAAGLWVAGFDVIYACQDLDFDRRQKLHSLPAACGLDRALGLSRLMHLGAGLFFWTLWPAFGLGPVYAVGCGLVSLVLCLEQFLVWRKLAHVPLAFFTLNGVVSVALFLFLLTDRLLYA